MGSPSGLSCYHAQSIITMIKLEVNHDHHLLKTQIVKPQPAPPDIPQPAPADPSLKSSLTETIATDKESTVIGNIQENERKLKRGLKEMIEDYKDQAERMMLNHGHDPQKEAAIRAHLAQLHNEKQERKLKLEADLLRLQRRKDSLSQSQTSSQQDVQEKRRSIEKRMAAMKERERRRQEEDAKFLQFYEEFKGKKPKYQQLEEEYKEQEEREKEQKLQQHKQQVQELFKPMDQEELAKFEEQYINRKYEAEKQRLQNQLMHKKQEEANLNKLEQLYRGNAHALLEQQVEARQANRQQAAQKIQRIREYSQMVKEDYRPRASSSVDMEEQHEDCTQPQTERGRRVVKDRYLKGEYQGKLVTYQKVPLSHSEHIEKGIQYLEFLKSLPKRQKQQTEQSAAMPPLPKKSTPVYYLPRQQNPLYRGRRYNSIDLTHLEDGDSVRRAMEFVRHRKEQLQLKEKVLKNGNFSSRQEWEAGQRDYNRNLVGSIEEKLQILKSL